MGRIYGLDSQHDWAKAGVVEICQDSQRDLLDTHPVFEVVDTDVVDVLDGDGKDEYRASDKQVPEFDLANRAATVDDLVRLLRAHIQATQLKFVIAGIGIDAVDEARPQGGVNLEQPADDVVGEFRCEVGNSGRAWMAASRSFCGRRGSK